MKRIEKKNEIPSHDAYFTLCEQMHMKISSSTANSGFGGSSVKIHRDCPRLRKYYQFIIGMNILRLYSINEIQVNAAFYFVLNREYRINLHASPMSFWYKAPPK